MINSQAVLTVNESELYQYNAEATDPDGDAIQYSLGTAPVTMTIDAQTGLISWSPNFESAGNHSVVIQATDPEGLFGIQSYTLDVSNINRAPIVSSSAITLGTENTSYSYDVEAMDPDDDALTYSLTNSPAGMTIDAQAGLITWTPSYESAGTHSVSIAVSPLCQNSCRL